MKEFKVVGSFRSIEESFIYGFSRKKDCVCGIDIMCLWAYDVCVAVKEPM